MLAKEVALSTPFNGFSPETVAAVELVGGYAISVSGIRATTKGAWSDKKVTFNEDELVRDLRSSGIEFFKPPDKLSEVSPAINLEPIFSKSGSKSSATAEIEIKFFATFPVGMADKLRSGAAVHIGRGGAESPEPQHPAQPLETGEDGRSLQRPGGYWVRALPARGLTMRRVAVVANHADLTSYLAPATRRALRHSYGITLAAVLRRLTLSNPYLPSLTTGLMAQMYEQNDDGEFVHVQVEAQKFGAQSRNVELLHKAVGGNLGPKAMTDVTKNILTYQIFIPEHIASIPEVKPALDLITQNGLVGADANNNWTSIIAKELPQSENESKNKVAASLTELLDEDGQVIRAAADYAPHFTEPVSLRAEDARTAEYIAMAQMILALQMLANPLNERGVANAFTRQANMITAVGGDGTLPESKLKVFERIPALRSMAAKSIREVLMTIQKNEAGAPAENAAIAEGVQLIDAGGMLLLVKSGHRADDDLLRVRMLLLNRITNESVGRIVSNMSPAPQVHEPKGVMWPKFKTIIQRGGTDAALRKFMPWIIKEGDEQFGFDVSRQPLSVVVTEGQAQAAGKLGALITSMANPAADQSSLAPYLAQLQGDGAASTDMEAAKRQALTSASSTSLETVTFLNKIRDGLKAHGPADSGQVAALLGEVEKFVHEKKCARDREIEDAVLNATSKAQEMAATEVGERLQKMEEMMSAMAKEKSELAQKCERMEFELRRSVNLTKQLGGELRKREGAHEPPDNPEPGPVGNEGDLEPKSNEDEWTVVSKGQRKGNGPTQKPPSSPPRGMRQRAQSPPRDARRGSGSANPSPNGSPSRASPNGSPQRASGSLASPARGKKATSRVHGGLNVGGPPPQGRYKTNGDAGELTPLSPSSPR